MKPSEIMRVAVVHPRDLGGSEIDQWRALQEADPAFDNPFLSPEFTLAVGGVRDKTRVAVLSDGPDIIGFFPFERHPLGIGRPVAAGLTDAQGMVHAKDAEIDPHRLIRDCGLDVFEFDHLVVGQPLASPTVTAHPSPIIDLSAGFDSYLTTVKERSGKTYRSTVNKRRKLERDVGVVCHEFATTSLSTLRTLLRWKTDQYRRTGRSNRFARRWIVELVQHLLATRGESFAGVLDMVYADGRPVAGHFGLRTRTTLVGWFPAYDPAFAKYSPGLIHHLAMIERAAASGIRVIDLGRGEKEYKEKLKNGEFAVLEGRLARPGVIGALHWLLSVPPRKTRNAVLASPRLRTTADRALKTYGRLRTGLTRRIPGDHR